MRYLSLLIIIVFTSTCNELGVESAGIGGLPDADFKVLLPAPGQEYLLEENGNYVFLPLNFYVEWDLANFLKNRELVTFELLNYTIKSLELSSNIPENDLSQLDSVIITINDGVDFISIYEEKLDLSSGTDKVLLENFDDDLILNLYKQLKNLDCHILLVSKETNQNNIELNAEFTFDYSFACTYRK